MMVDEMYSDNNKISRRSLKSENMEYIEGNPLRKGNLLGKGVAVSSSSNIKNDHLSPVKHENLSHAHPISNDEVKSLIMEIESTE